MKRLPGLLILFILSALAAACHVGTFTPPDAPLPPDAGAAAADAGGAAADAGVAAADAMPTD
jgi:hypothetical protein